MTIYLAILAEVVVLGAAMTLSDSLRESGGRVYAAVIVATLFAVSAVRSFTVGVDTEQFCRAYIRIGQEGALAFDLERYEYLFTALCLWLNELSDNYQLLIIVSSALSLVPVGYLVYKCSENAPLSFFLYITLNMYFSSMNIMRQSIALGIIAIGLVWLIRDKSLPFVASVAVAYLFHRSAVFLLVLLFVRKLPFNRKVFLAYIAASAVVFLLSDPLANLVASLYGTSTLYDETFMGSNFFGAAFKAAVAFACGVLCVNYIAFSRRRGEEGPHDSLYQHGLMLWLLFSVFMMKIEIVGRLSEYFMLFAILAIPMAMKRIPKKERSLVLLVVGGCFLLYFVFIGAARPEWYGAIPYVADFDNVLAIFQ